MPKPPRTDQRHNSKFVGTMTGMARSGRSWDVEIDFLDHEMLSRYNGTHDILGDGVRL